MGLDIYLYSKQQRKQNALHEKEWEALYARKESGEIDDEEYDSLRTEVTPYTSYTDAAPHDPNLADAKNINNRRYLRSSYNEGGFNRAVPHFLADPSANYYSIFAPVIGDNPEPYETVFLPGHIGALHEVAERFRDVAARLDTCDAVTVTHVTGSNYATPNATAEDALTFYRKAVAQDEERRAKILAEGRNPDDDHFFGGGWSSGGGSYMGATPLRVRAAVPGVDVIGQSCVYLVFESSRESVNSYRDSALIAAEFCEEAIDLIKADGECLMTWSG